MINCQKIITNEKNAKRKCKRNSVSGNKYCFQHMEKCENQENENQESEDEEDEDEDEEYENEEELEEYDFVKEKLLELKKNEILKIKKPCYDRSKKNCENECFWNKNNSICVETNPTIQEIVKLVCSGDKITQKNIIEIAKMTDLKPEYFQLETYEELTQSMICNLMTDIIRYVYEKYTYSDKPWEEIGMSKKGWNYYLRFVRNELNQGRGFWDLHSTIFRKGIAELNVGHLRKLKTGFLIAGVFIAVMVIGGGLSLLGAGAGGIIALSTIPPAINVDKNPDQSNRIVNIETGEGVNIVAHEPKIFNTNTLISKGMILNEEIKHNSILDHHIIEHFRTNSNGESSNSQKKESTFIKSLSQSNMFECDNFRNISFTEEFPTINEKVIINDVKSFYKIIKEEKTPNQVCEIGLAAEKEFIDVILNYIDVNYSKNDTISLEDKDYGIYIGQQIYYGGAFKQPSLTHHGIYVGNGLVFEVGQGPTSCKGLVPIGTENKLELQNLVGFLKQVAGLSTLDNFVKRATEQKSKLYVVQTLGDRDVDIVTTRLKMVKNYINYWAYNPFNNNCQTPANSITFGSYLFTSENNENHKSTIHGEHIGKHMKYGAILGVLGSVYVIGKLLKKCNILSFDFILGGKEKMEKIKQIENKTDFLENKKEASIQLLRWWEIRSWVHLKDPSLFNKKGDDWSHHQNEPLMGIGNKDENKLLQWAKNQLNKKNITSYFFKNEKYKIIKELHESTLLNIYGEKGSIHKSTGFIATNMTKNKDGEKGKVIYICFRETTSPIEMSSWINPTLFGSIKKLKNMRKMSNNEFIEINNGIWNVYNGDIRDEIVSFLEENSENIEKIIIIGMSLGGALAQCACIDVLRFFEGESINMVLFASPKVYTVKSVKYLTKMKVNCYRVEADNHDCVVGFPSSLNYRDWKHLGTPIRLKVINKDMISCDETLKQILTVKNEYEIYYGKVEFEVFVPALLIYGPCSDKNFHTRTNYQKFFYIMALQNLIKLEHL